MSSTCPSDPAATVDQDGFCSAHGNDCADYHLHLQEAAQDAPTDQEGVEEADEELAGQMAAAPVEGAVIAFLADSRASTLLLEETVAMLVESQQVAQALVELHSLPGVRIAAALHRAGVSYSVLSFGPDLPEHAGDDEVPEVVGVEHAGALLAHAEQVVQVDPRGFGWLHAQLCVVPACVGSDEVHLDGFVEDVQLDMSPTTLPGLVMDQASLDGRAMLLIDAPERGIVRQADGAYRRRVIHIGQQARARSES